MRAGRVVWTIAVFILGCKPNGAVGPKPTTDVEIGPLGKETSALDAKWAWVLSPEGKALVLSETDFVRLTPLDPTVKAPSIICAKPAGEELHKLLEESIKKNGSPQEGEYFQVSNATSTQMLRFGRNDTTVSFKGNLSVPGAKFDTTFEGSSTNVSLVVGIMPREIVAKPKYIECLESSVSCDGAHCSKQNFVAPTAFLLGSLVVLRFKASTVDGSALADVQALASARLKVNLENVQLQYNQYGRASFTSDDLMSPLMKRPPSPSETVKALDDKTTVYSVVATLPQTFASTP